MVFFLLIFSDYTIKKDFFTINTMLLRFLTYQVVVLFDFLGGRVN